MADINIGRSVCIAFKTRPELVAFAGRIKRIEHLAQCFADKVLRQFRPVFSPVRFHNTRIGRIDIDQETVVLPEIPDLRPEHFRRTVDDQPPLAAMLFDANIGRFIGSHHTAGRADGHIGPCFLLLLVITRRRHHSRFGNGITVVSLQLGQIGGNFEPLSRSLRSFALVINPVRFKQTVNGTARRQPDHRQRANQNGTDFFIKHHMFQLPSLPVFSVRRLTRDRFDRQGLKPAHRTPSVPF